MKPLILFCFLLAPLFSFSQQNTAALLDSELARCTGSAYCRACKNCNYCKHCNSGGSCGVCSPATNYNKNTTGNNYRFSDHYVYVKNEKMNLRSGPGTTYTIVTTINKNSELYLIEYLSSGWVKVRYEYWEEGEEKSVMGYALKSLLKDSR
ncbi:MAG: SH3 domain-containing protein [Candidatus Cyclobacteriaceae bacterium M2_1C_046]